MQRFIDRVAFVTGGGHGIGRATCLRLAREGASVVVADLDQAAAVAFLASDDAAWITGVTLPVDGGVLTGPKALAPPRPGPGGTS